MNGKKYERKSDEFSTSPKFSKCLNLKSLARVDLLYFIFSEEVEYDKLQVINTVKIESSPFTLLEAVLWEATDI